ncbi:hypothetical protein [Terriglobus tenax]|uniref:hypothetical protein n=1 Tax=Terriglobus tenax TaxID=1111115 RepID=UPI0021E03E7D|nr:hypothetical protein [Terriglobus tenax]
MTLSTKSYLRALVFLAGATAVTANAQPGHGYPPPGQAKHDDHYDDRRDNRYDNRHDNRPDWHFRGNERDRFRGYYSNDIRRWQGRRRPNFYAGYAIPRTYRVQPVPPPYYNGLQPPPPGYQYGYYGGYVVAYNPTTRVIADVVDLIGTLANR